MSNFQAPRGTEDIFGKKMRIWRAIEAIVRRNCEVYHVTEMKTPMFEHTEVFNRGNDGSDVVNKEMYTFKDRGDRSLTLKPEGTAGVIRSYVQHKLFGISNDIQRYFYIAPNFRYERPQKGRMRIHHQFGVEFIGEASPYIDVEAITLALKVLNELGITEYKLVINTLGDAASQKAYRDVLVDHFTPYIDEMGADNQRRLKQNPLRILDDKFYQEHEALVNAPSNKDTLTESSIAYFDDVCKILEDLNIPYEVDAKLVRGLDYYHHTVFEVISTDKKSGAQSTITGGGRYNHLVEHFGGPSISAFGFGMGIERLMVFLESAGIDIGGDESIDVYGMPLSEEANTPMFEIVTALRNAGIICDMDFHNRSMKAKYRSAERMGAKVVMTMGSSELESKKVTLKNIETQEQVSVDLDDVLVRVKEWIGE